MSRAVDNAVDAAYDAYAAGDFAHAKAACAAVLRKAPRNDRALHLLGTIRLREGDGPGAVALLQKTARLRPADDRVLEDLGTALLASGEHAAAEQTLRRALKLARTPRASLNARLAHALAGLGRWPDARAGFAEAARLEPDQPDARFNLAIVLEREGHDEEAAQAYEELVARFPDYADGWVNLGIVQERLERRSDAVRSYRRALQADPDSVHALANLGKALRSEGELDQAKAACVHALRIDPRFTDARVNLAAVLAQEGRTEEALAQYEEVLEHEPQAADVHYSYAALMLALGRFSAGWRHYRWRPTRLRADASGMRVAARLPQPLAGRELVVVGEQGLGDELFFLRYARELAAGGARVHVQCDARLVPLVERTRVFETVFPPQAGLPRADDVFIAGDLPLIFDEARRPLVPAPLALVPLEERTRRLRDRFAAMGSPPYICLTWRAGTPPSAQRGRPDPALYKSVPADVLGAALQSVPGTLIALQRAPLAGEIERLSRLLARTVHDLSAVNDDLEDMLALLALLDDYVGVSNTNMHMRAGVGRSARVLVPNPPEWRWMWSGERSPWFPAFEVYRETFGAGWNTAARRLSDDLVRSAAGNKG